MRRYLWSRLTLHSQTSLWFLYHRRLLWFFRLLFTHSNTWICATLALCGWLLPATATFCTFLGCPQVPAWGGCCWIFWPPSLATITAPWAVISTIFLEFGWDVIVVHWRWGWELLGFLEPVVQLPLVCHGFFRLKGHRGEHRIRKQSHWLNSWQNIRV